MMRNSLPALLLLALAACSADSSTQSAGEPSSYPDMQSEGYARLAAYCAQCHMPPMPGVHTPHEWTQVVRRMQKHRVARGLGAIPDADVRVLLAYLKAHARSAS